MEKQFRLAPGRFAVVAFAPQSQAVSPSAERDYPTCLAFSDLSINPFHARKRTTGDEG
jgi:hypothetical protein